MAAARTAEYQLTGPMLRRIAEIIHEADLDDERYDAPGHDITVAAYP